MKIKYLSLFFVCVISSPVFGAEQTISVDCTKLADCAQRIVEIGNRLIQENQKLSDRLKVLEAIKGGVVAFDLDKCPDTWSPYAPAAGRFVRGLDTSDPTRTRGSLQDDAFQGHTFGDGDTKIFRYSPSHTTIDRPDGYSNMQSSGIFGANPAFGDTTPARIVSDGANNSPRTAKETRPKNVALLYCVKN